MVGGITYVPLRFVSEALGAKVDWDEKTGTATVSLDGKDVLVKVSSSGSAGIKQYSRQVGNIRATVVAIPPGAPVRAVVTLARDRVGATEDLASMAKRYGAVAAINGTFFEAYGGIPEPWGTIIKDGKVVHVGNVGSVVGITSDGRVKMDTVRIKVEGGTGGSYEWPDNWYAYGFNRTPSPGGSAAYIYTRERGGSLGFAYGTSVVVSGGKVVRVVENQDVTIPDDGFVVNLTGSERYLRNRFEPGKNVSYRVVFEDKDGNRLDWSDVVTAVGAGPRLLTGGRITVDPAGEGFTSAKIITGGGGEERHRREIRRQHFTGDGARRDRQAACVGHERTGRRGRHEPRRRSVIGTLLQRPLPHCSGPQDKQRTVIRPCFVGRQRVLKGREQPGSLFFCYQIFERRAFSFFKK